MLSNKIFRTCLKLPRRLIVSPNNRVANIHVSTCLPNKLYIDHENRFAHEVLERSEKPYQLFRAEVNSPKKPQKLQLDNVAAIKNSPPEIFAHFSDVLRFCIATSTRISDLRFKEITEEFCNNCDLLSDDELMNVLRLVASLPIEDTPRAMNFMELWNALDVACCQRVENWSRDQLLLVCDAWYVMNLARISDFVKEALRKLGRKVRRMTPEQLVQAMFFCNVARRPAYEMFDFEENLVKCVDSMSLEELGVMSMGFFKTQTPIRNPALIEQLYHRLMAELDTVQDITLVAILKLLRYSSKLPQVKMMVELLDKLCPQVDRLSLLSCLHVALMGSELQCCHEEIVERVLHRFNKEVKQARLKDMERICLVMGVFNYVSPTGVDKELSKNILNELQGRIDEILQHPRAFVHCLHFLSLRGVYDSEMISAVLEPKFLNHSYGSNVATSREIYHLDAFAKINLREEYEGPQLTEKLRRTLARGICSYMPERNPKYKLNVTDRILLEIKETTDRIFRRNAFKHILPHYERPDIVFCYDKQQRRDIPLSSDCPEDFCGTILTRSELIGPSCSEDIDTVAIIVVGWNNVVRERNRHTAMFDMKLEQLRILGHKYILIYWHEWRALETQIDCQNFLKRRISQIITL